MLKYLKVLFLEKGVYLYFFLVFIVILGNVYFLLVLFYREGEQNFEWLNYFLRFYLINGSVKIYIQKC